MHESELTTLLHLAEGSALLAGRRLQAYQREWSVIIAEHDRDVKVKADRLAEELILSQLKGATKFPILTEETGWHGVADEHPVWIVDPLDGSFNYSQRIPFCCVAIGLVKQGKPLLGVIYDFNHEELFSGIVGVGAWLNYFPIQVSNTIKSRSGVLNTGFPARRDYSAEALNEFFHRTQRWRKVRMLGSAALALAYVAAGRADAYEEQGTMFWDVAAGCALVEAAGGNVSLSGDIYQGPINAQADNGKLELTV